MMRTTIIAAAFALSLGWSAHASDSRALVDAAIAKCEIGETIAGYLAEVDDKASPEAVAAMKEINIRRRAVFADLARAQQVTIEVVARVTGEKQIANAAPGACVMDASGAWTQK